MKRLVFTLVMITMVSLSFAQKKTISSAKRALGGTPPKFEEARKLIGEALVNPETESQAETWFVAGQIESKQFDDENMKEVLGQGPNLELMYNALTTIMPYFQKAYELEQIPDAKGKVQSKYTKDIRSILRSNRIHYINAGVFYHDKKDFQKAYENFKLYGDIPTLPMMKGDEFTKESNDSLSLQIRYYAGLSAVQIPDHKAALEIFIEMKDKGYLENEVHQHLVHQYDLINDTIGMERTLKEGSVKFPEDPYFMLNLINLNIKTGNTDEAVKNLLAGIEKTPNNAELYDVLGQVYESRKEIDNSIKCLEKALEIDPGNAAYLAHIGKVYYNYGVEARANADNNISNNALYDLEMLKSKERFQKALPYLEEAYKLNSEDKNTIFALRSIYYNLNMNTEFEKMDAIFSAGNPE
jgi:Tetratricopeptide repeat.